MILVTSAAGGVGRALVKDLHARGAQVRAFVKNDSQAELSRGDGATEVVVGDIESCTDLARAASGVRVVFHATPTSIVNELALARSLVEATRASDVEHVVYHSVIHPEITEMFHHQEKLRVEGIIRESGIPFTFLRASHFMQNYLDFWEFLLAGTLPYPTSPDQLMGVVDVEDVAEASALVLTAPEGHRAQTYDLSAHELTRREMAVVWSRVLGHPVSAVRLPPSVVQNPLHAVSAVAPILARSLLSTKLGGLPHVLRGMQDSSNARGVRKWSPESRECYRRMMEYYDGHGLPAGDMAVLPRLLGRNATTYEQFARREATRRVASR
ncbi:NmrA family protein [Rhodococcus sp. 05-340-1]|uniref:SDR family oxidoreductase n=1 Tax=Nocardiaceae TaxID=85025 RepID=UPI00050C0F37|nr:MULTISPECIES: NmrA family NAD(P)-binding protein [Rhodococcus]OZC87699.1 NmrA family protein [Rhodococcus sp. 06-412-2C]OZC96350.1 NmrA family protein [Rhodococcus sp. 06-412-2B]OZD65334.1 NmrA family protein [Rhodococcus sp. 05-340-2]OZD74620.1 NmrA family protein [Rhodococcus sp. 05-340-1]OZD86607.1 NmrA family protein [Rhodococcus sp. 05-339-2]